MSIDYGEVERQFVAALKADTGRSLEEWLAAIDGQGLAQRNDIIDWLRRQGFMFAKASWIERIRNNGGRPIYETASGPRPAARARPRPGLAKASQGASDAAPAPPVLPPPQPAAPAAPPPASATDAAALEALLARAKAFRPLAAYVIAEIRKAVPGVVVTAHDGHATFHAGAAAFAVLGVSAKELRLGVAAAAPPGAPWEAARLGLKNAPPASHMVVLTDARQVTPALLAAVVQAAGGR